jgi:hypothetical protein
MAYYPSTRKRTHSAHLTKGRSAKGLFVLVYNAMGRQWVLYIVERVLGGWGFEVLCACCHHVLYLMRVLRTFIYSRVWIPADIAQLFCMSFLGIFTQSVGLSLSTTKTQNTMPSSLLPTPKLTTSFPRHRLSTCLQRKLEGNQLPLLRIFREGHAYAHQGGTSPIMICDNDMQLVSP